MAWKFFVGGNWNFNGTSEEVKKIVSTLNDRKVASADVVDVVVSPPYVFLRIVKSLLLPDFHVAAQNCWMESRKGWSGHELLLLGESNEFVGDKVAYALSKGIKVIGCVGETLQRESGATMDVIAAQTKTIACFTISGLGNWNCEGCYTSWEVNSELCKRLQIYVC
ncbi:unnamed protein product [Musa acuminata var. zebrina]